MAGGSLQSHPVQEVNDVEKRHYAIPFGGWKDSGVGVEYGIDEVLSLTRQKTYMINYS